uniref:Uncharacterized protein LOC111100968 n=1 Tax=Crassostrea virginica TaxID=6565 RepID=A0A8B8ABK5_CRAVI|nr:uncharacterized protein LOC111100968 [Crassostrea virginica]
MNWKEVNFLLLWSYMYLLINLASTCQEKTVRTCPTTEEKWLDASLRKNCSSCTTSNVYVYHCVANENGLLIEVCTNSIFLQGVCPYYDSVGEVLQMGSACKRCPPRFSSTNVYKYSECFPPQVSPHHSGGIRKYCMEKSYLLSTLMIHVLWVIFRY